MIFVWSFSPCFAKKSSYNKFPTEIKEYERRLESQQGFTAEVCKLLHGHENSQHPSIGMFRLRMVRKLHRDLLWFFSYVNDGTLFIGVTSDKNFRVKLSKANWIYTRNGLFRVLMGFFFQFKKFSFKISDTLAFFYHNSHHQCFSTIKITDNRRTYFSRETTGGRSMVQAIFPVVPYFSREFHCKLVDYKHTNTNSYKHALYLFLWGKTSKGHFIGKLTQFGPGGPLLNINTKMSI